MRLEIGGVVIRSWEPADVAAIARHANDRRVWLRLRDRFPHPYGEADARAWLESVAREDPEVNLAIATTTEAIGGIGLVIGTDVHRRTAEIGYWLGAEHWGRGIATRAVTVFTAWAFASLELDRIHAAVFAGNDASARVLDKCGYRLEGRLRQSVVKDGRTLDQTVWAILREDVPPRARAHRSPPLDVTSVASRPRRPG